MVGVKGDFLADRAGKFRLEAGSVRNGMILGRLLESWTKRGGWLAKNCYCAHIERETFGTAYAGRKVMVMSRLGAVSF